MPHKVIFHDIISTIIYNCGDPDYVTSIRLDLTGFYIPNCTRCRNTRKCTHNYYIRIIDLKNNEFFYHYVYRPHPKLLFNHTTERYAYIHEYLNIYIKLLQKNECMEKLKYILLFDINKLISEYISCTTYNPIRRSIYNRWDRQL